MGPDSCPRLALKVDWKYEPGALGLPIEHILAQEVSFEVVSVAKPGILLKWLMK